MFLTRSKIMNKGFSLIEMIVATAVFSVAIVIIMMTTLNLNDIQRKAFAMREVNDSASFSAELMNKEIMAGSGYQCEHIDAFGRCDTFSFSHSSDTITYSFNSGNNSIERSLNGDSPLRLTSPNVKIERLVFDIKGGESGDGRQSQVQIFIKASSGEKLMVKTNFSVQTLVCQRDQDS